MNPWSEKKLQDFHDISFVKDNNKELGILKNDQGQFVSLETNMPLDGNYKIQGDTYNFKNGLLHGEVFGATYRNGLLHGVIRQYSTYYNGKSTPSYLSAKLHFVNGVPSGTQTWFSPSGDIIETAFYQKGKRLSYKKKYKKIKSQYTIPKYDDEKSKVIHKFLEVCSKSKVEKRFDNRSHIFVLLDMILIQTACKKNTQHIETINLLSLIMKTFLGGKNPRTIIGAVEDIHRMITMKMYYLIKKAPIYKYFRQRKNLVRKVVGSNTIICTFLIKPLYI